jgi:hypothetical protein
LLTFETTPFFCVNPVYSGRFSSTLILKGLEIGISLQSLRRFLATLLLSATSATEDILFSIICDNCFVLDVAGCYFDISAVALANCWELLVHCSTVSSNETWAVWDKSG